MKKKKGILYFLGTYKYVTVMSCKISLVEMCSSKLKRVGQSPVKQKLCK